VLTPTDGTRRIVLFERHEHADPLHARCLLRARRKRPSCGCSAEQSDVSWAALLTGRAYHIVK